MADATFNATSQYSYSKYVRLRKYDGSTWSDISRYWLDPYDSLEVSFQYSGGSKYAYQYLIPIDFDSDDLYIVVEIPSFRVNGKLINPVSSSDVSACQVSLIDCYINSSGGLSWSILETHTSSSYFQSALSRWIIPVDALPSDCNGISFYLSFTYSDPFVVMFENNDLVISVISAVDSESGSIPDGVVTEDFLITALDSQTQTIMRESTSILSTWYNSWTTWVGQTGTTTLSDWLFNLWSKLSGIDMNTYNIEQKLDALLPSKEETAIKEATKETTQAVVDEVFAEDAPTKVSVSDVKDVAEIGSAASSMFDSGVSVGSFFNALNNIRFIAFFSQETYDDLNTVQFPVTYSLDDESGYVDYYSENMDKIQQFVGGE